ncbi:MAG TPA: glutamine-hydrolyzing carbamoyl-phosphate synthase small subunit [Acidimicrobiales bacterium]|nr:glutamine-hydrolyzing carbamoyl-phosphate synthase small subunit [Acidimicrobiales bacterium]
MTGPGGALAGDGAGLAWRDGDGAGLAWRDGMLVLADGTAFEGEVLVPAPRGTSPDVPDGPARGEVVFNTVMAGYQEVLTDPSYAGQVICFTYPHIGNYGVVPEDDESRRPFCRGVIVRELTGRPSNWRAVETLGAFLQRHGLWAIAGVDTRRLTRCLRDEGSMPGAFGPVDGGPGGFDEAGLLAIARAEAPTNGRDLVREVTCSAPYTYGEGPYSVVAYDFGIKRNILRNLASVARVTVVPAGTPAGEVLDMDPDGIFLSNGPGDPAAVEGATATVRELLGKKPVFGICLGHQILAQALGASTFKLPFGHHGGNHPVRRLASGTVEITSQNHNYAVAPGTFEGGVDVTHVNLNDGVIEGFACRDVPAFSVQYHPEAGPGPHDARYLFKEFAELMQRTGAKPGRTGSFEPAGGNNA